MATRKVGSISPRRYRSRPWCETFETLATVHLFDSQIYHWSLGHGDITQVACTPPDPWPGDVSRGSRILREPVAYADPGAPMRSETTALLDHDFSWLRDLRSIGGDRARHQARKLVARWIDENHRWSPGIWEQGVTGRRVVSWLTNYDFFCASADDGYRTTVSQSLMRQLRHLRWISRIGPRDSDRLAALGALVIASHALPGQARMQDRMLQRLGRELVYQIGPDGAHIERCPSRQLMVLRQLVELRAALAGAGRELPSWLAECVATLGQTLALLRHGDGGLAAFNTGRLGRPATVDMVLDRAGSGGGGTEGDVVAGFGRLAAEDVRVFFDVAEPPPPGSDRRAGAGTLAFEMSIGAERLIVNCGALGEMGRTTAAHSTAVVDDTNSAQVLVGLGFGARPSDVPVRRAAEDGSTLLEASHDGYLGKFGVIHHRRLYLAAAADDLRGEDRIEGSEGSDQGKRFTIRFHLHPDVRTDRIPERRIVILSLPSGGRWRFRATGGELTVAESIFLDNEGEPRPSKQILVAGLLKGRDALVKWSLRRQDNPST